MKAKNINIDSTKQEISQTIPGFPVSCYHSKFTSDTYDYIDWHWHMEFQLCLTTHGTVIWNTESHKVLIPAGDGIFINSQQVHMARPLEKEAAFFCIDIPPDFLCPEKESLLYHKSVRPVLEETSLDHKIITRQMQFTVSSGLHSVLERPFSEANGRSFLVKRSPLIVC